MSTACSAAKIAPLALMNLRPDHSRALVPAPTAIRASKPLPLVLRTGADGRAGFDPAGKIPQPRACRPAFEGRWLPPALAKSA
jgi:hypothetical protein